jgi:hypothetical protein
VYFEAAEIAHVGAAGGVGVEQEGRRSGHGKKIESAEDAD